MAHILIVDDDDLVAEVAAEILRAAGHVCACASDTAEAWRLLQWRRPDLLVLGEALPGEGGVSFAQRVRQSAACHGLPVLMLAAEGSGPDVIAKPLQPLLLQGKVAQLAGDRQRADWAEFQLRSATDDPPRPVYL